MVNLHTFMTVLGIFAHIYAGSSYSYIDLHRYLVYLYIFMLVLGILVRVYINTVTFNSCIYMCLCRYLVNQYIVLQVLGIRVSNQITKYSVLLINQSIN
jgi:hypothetical protein